MFALGNYSIDEILYGVASEYGGGKILYTLDQLSSASIEISSESTDITDKKGNIVRTIYKTKTGTFNATNAFLHPQIQAAGTGGKVETGEIKKVPMLQVVAKADAETTAYTFTNIIPDEGSIDVVGITSTGANIEVFESNEEGATAMTYAYDGTGHKVTIQNKEASVIKYVIKYTATIADGMKISNIAKAFPDTVQLDLYCSFVDPCDGELQLCVVQLPSFQPSPETTVSLNADEQEMDFTGSIQLDYCSVDQPLYHIYFPNQSAKVVAGV